MVVIKNNRAYIRKNEQMRPDKQDPDFTGSANIEGVEYWISAWNDDDQDRDGKPNGKKVMSCSFKPKQQNNTQQNTQQTNTQEDDDGWGL